MFAENRPAKVVAAVLDTGIRWSVLSRSAVISRSAVMFALRAFTVHFALTVHFLTVHLYSVFGLARAGVRRPVRCLNS